jgi:CHAD domain-containing protein
MNDVIRDIDVLKNAIVALCEGASDEKHMALNSLTRLVEEKEKIVEEFEKEFADDTPETIAA